MDGLFQSCRTGKDGALEPAAGQHREPAFNEIEPRRVGWCEVQMPAWAFYEPVPDDRGLMGHQIVQDEVDFQIGWHKRLDLVEKTAKHDAAVLLPAPADYPAGPHVQGGEQVRGAMAPIIMAPALGLAGLHRQNQRCSLVGLDLPLFIHA